MDFDARSRSTMQFSCRENQTIMHFMRECVAHFTFTDRVTPQRDAAEAIDLFPA